jgi:superfamily II DNA or RNA helicase
VELKLYERLRRELLGAGTALRVDERDPGTQRRLERYDPELPLEREPLERIRTLNEELNTLLPEQRLHLRHYQILALSFTEFALRRPGRRLLAYWMATGSGKTRIMHLNLLRHLRHTLKERDGLQVILTTPLTNLIAQHRRELVPLVERLNRREGGERISLLIETTQALLNQPEDFFALPDDGRTHRLVLVDEAHIGLGARTEGEFTRLRNRLNQGRSFLYEYSATFHNLGGRAETEYGEAIVYDYQYRTFYRDGYGKDHFFRRIGEDVADAERPNILQNLEVLEEKLRAWEVLERRFPDRPLLAFLGGSVAGGEASDELSDVQLIVKTLAELTEAERAWFGRVFHGQTVGRLVLTRNRAADDEILLAYGDAEPWGMINVGDSEGFLRKCDDPRVLKRVDTLPRQELRFENIDSPASPLNVLIGSRKFAEGWNSFRLSMIGLINLGTSRGNKIVQIFGRGVRLRGEAGEGKRRHHDRVTDYFGLGRSEEDEWKRLETLVVLSLKDSYLRTFIEEVHKTLRWPVPVRLPVAPAAVALGDGTCERFEEYAPRLPVFKLSRKPAGFQRLVLHGDGSFTYTYRDIESGETKRQRLEKFRIERLDYRVDREREGEDVKDDLARACAVLQPFLDRTTLARAVHAAAADAKVRVYAEAEGVLRPPELPDLLAFVEQVRYREPLGEAPALQRVERLGARVAAEVVGRLARKARHDINSRHYVLHEPLQPGTDFITEYTVTREFDRAAEAEAFQARPESERRQVLAEQLNLLLHENPLHVYRPLVGDRGSDTPLTVSPDLLNAAEAEFAEQLATYIRRRFAGDGRYGFYLMRNVESLRSIGVYLEGDEAVFFPDFVLWIEERVEGGRTWLVLLDPKGQTGMTSEHEMNLNEKVRLALKDSRTPTLVVLERRLTEARGRPCEIHSFLLLPKSSRWGTRGAGSRRKLIEHNVLRLDWNPAPPTAPDLAGKSYLAMLFDRLGI